MPTGGGPLILPHGGTRQGRADTGFGTAYSLNLGSFDEAVDDVAEADYAEVAQTVDLTNVDALTFRLGVRGVSEEYPPDLLLHCGFNDLQWQGFAPDYFRDGSAPVIAPLNSPSIAPPGVSRFGYGALQCIGASPEGVEYSGAQLASLVDTGCVRFRVKPNYSGTPTDSQAFFGAWDTGGVYYNTIAIGHTNGGKLLIAIFDATGSGPIIYDTSVAWSPTGGTWHDHEINFDTTPGSGFGAKWFIDGDLKGSWAGTGVRSNLTNWWAFGAFTGTTDVQDFTLDEALVFDAVQHTENYYPDITQVTDGTWIFRVLVGSGVVWKEEFRGVVTEYPVRSVNVAPYTGSQTVRFRLVAA